MLRASLVDGVTFCSLPATVAVAISDAMKQRMRLVTAESAALFWSYSHDDNLQDDERIVRLAADLANEYELITGTPLDVFIDRKAIRWGDEWRARIDSALADTTFFVPILTPRYFHRPECRKELLDFWGNAESFGVAELLLPILYIEVPNFTEDNPDEAIALAARMQYEPWHVIRLEDSTSDKYRQAVNRLAKRLAGLGASAGAKLTNREVVRASEGDSTPGLLDLISELRPLIAEWLELVLASQVTNAMYSAVGGEWTARIRKIKRSGGSHAQELGAIQRMAVDELPLAQKYLAAIERYGAMTIELSPLVMALVREFDASGQSPSIARFLIDAVDEAIVTIRKSELALQRPDTEEASTFWSRYGKLSRVTRELMTTQMSTSRVAAEANERVATWHRELLPLFVEPTRAAP